MRIRCWSTVAVALLALPARGFSGGFPVPATGNLIGTVLDPQGVPQMGATVRLYDRFQRLVGQTLTTPEGRFGFVKLGADSYSIRVSLSSFFPAYRDRVLVKAGLNSLLQVHLATLLSNIEITYALPNSVMAEDWKWVLRSSPATRPITRYLPVAATSQTQDENDTQVTSQIFSGTHTMLSLTGGDGSSGLDGAQTDLGTSFALTTDVLGTNHLQFSGSYGQNPVNGAPAVVFSATYSRPNNGANIVNMPEVTLTMRQLSVAGSQNLAAGNLIAGQLPVVRDIAITVYQTLDLGDSMYLEYGTTGETVTSVGQTTRVSPFARATTNLGSMGLLVAAYSNGGRPDALYAHQQSPQDAWLNDSWLNDSVMLARLPQLSYSNHALELQRTQSYELGYKKTVGSTTYAASVFHENVNNGTVDVTGDVSGLNTGNLLSDGMSNADVYNIGRYNRTGYIASADRRIGDNIDLTVAYGRMGGITAAPGAVIAPGTSLDFIQHNMASVNMHVRAPITGTHISANYGWVQDGAIVPMHIFTTQNVLADPGLDIRVRQPLPSFFGMPGHLEVVADVHNLLAQGYQPMNAGQNGRLLMIQTPRAVRGGVSFVF
ncbi:MAG: TonB-dependent receptor [Bryobacteraceae bacterium]